MTNELKWPYNLKKGDYVLYRYRSEVYAKRVDDVTEKTVVIDSTRYRKDILQQRGDFKYGISEATPEALDKIKARVKEKRDRVFVATRVGSSGLPYSKILKIKEIIEQE